MTEHAHVPLTPCFPGLGLFPRVSGSHFVVPWAAGAWVTRSLQAMGGRLEEMGRSGKGRGDHPVVVVVVYLQRGWKWKGSSHIPQTLFCPISHVLEALVTR